MLPTLEWASLKHPVHWYNTQTGREISREYALRLLQDAPRDQLEPRSPVLSALRDDGVTAANPVVYYTADSRAYEVCGVQVKSASRVLMLVEQALDRAV